MRQNLCSKPLRLSFSVSFAPHLGPVQLHSTNDYHPVPSTLSDAWDAGLTAWKASPTAEQRHAGTQESRVPSGKGRPAQGPEDSEGRVGARDSLSGTLKGV